MDYFVLQEEQQGRTTVATFLSSLGDHSVTVGDNPADPDSKRPTGAEMGTMIGVYLPCLQSIFGVLLFIRLPWVVGIAGALQGFIVVFICCCITLLTSISMSAIATNGVVPAGGSYYMISRALGPEFGGAVGLLFYLGNTVAGAMYIIGAIEILLLYIAPGMSVGGDIEVDLEARFNNFRLYGTVLLFLLCCIILIGVKLVNVFASIALAGVLLSILAIYVGIFVNVDGSDNIMMCLLGNRLLNEDKIGGNCSKEFGTPLFMSLCSLRDNESSLINESSYQCDPYFNENEVHLVPGIPGLSSGVFLENIQSSYLYSGAHLLQFHEKDSVGEVDIGESSPFVHADMTTTFIALTGIFFSSVTGIMAGSNLSGDLKDVSRSIPIGTLSATITTSAVYLSCVLFFAGSVNGLLLRDKFGESVGGKLVVASLAWPNQWVILVGSLLSTIGAGVQSLIGAPRLLQAISHDDIIPFLRPFGVSAANGEPRRALFVTWAICQITVLIGNVDDINPLLSCFFLMCYGFVNLACALQTLLHTPNWRPRFEYYHWTLSFLGLSLCAAVMFMCSWYFALAAIGLAVLIYKYIEYRGAEKEWGDGIRGLALSGAHFALLRLEEGPPHIKNWRPQILILAELDDHFFPKHKKMFAFASQLKAGKGLTMAVSVIEGEYSRSHEEVIAAKQSLRNVMNEERVKGFVDVLVSEDVIEGMSYLIQMSGIGGMKPNTVFLGWPEDWRSSSDDESWRAFIEALRTVAVAKMAVLIPKGIKCFPNSNERVSGYIDIWWIVHDGGLLMLLPFLLCQCKTWRNCHLRIFTVAQVGENSVRMTDRLKRFLYQVRIKADVEVIEMSESDISAYTIEQVLRMEQRTQIIRKLGLTRKESSNLIQHIRDLEGEPDEDQKESKSLFHFGETPIQAHGKVEAASSPPSDSSEKNMANDHIDGKAVELDQNKISPIPIEEMKHKKHESIKERKSDTRSVKRKLTEVNVRRMHTASKLNGVILSRSHEAQLVVLNLPEPPKATKRDSDVNYMAFLEILTEGLERVLMVRGSGREVITIYS
ncbi:unnamed protein product [Darwinula stevensoni]|uniref:Solute carrier family 12 member 6 n=1 Tax=Darwinula stevensoni TaxID=69355 RepID=A0A7R9A8N0_9CRUS|nr:unnamed protein product [Darwinula stevensoni]CAG0896607.1 unnamed protein product [Darwinula stevensoni]